MSTHSEIELKQNSFQLVSSIIVISIFTRMLKNMLMRPKQA